MMMGNPFGRVRRGRRPVRPALLSLLTLLLSVTRLAALELSAPERIEAKKLSGAGSPRKIALSVLKTDRCYPGYGPENSLDGNPNNNYTAYYLQKNPTELTLVLKRQVSALELALVFESAQNYAEHWRWEALDPAGKVVAAGEIRGNSRDQNASICAEKEFTALHLVFDAFHGQKRLLLRAVSAVEPAARKRHHLAFGGALPLTEMSLSNVVFDPGCTSGAIDVWASEKSGRKLRKLYSEKVSGPGVFAISGRASTVLVECRGFQCDVDFFTVESDYQRLKTLLAADKEILLDARDPANPLSVCRRPITKAHKMLADEILRKFAAASDPEKVLAFMSYITVMNVGFSVKSSPGGTLLEEVGSCGTFSNALVALCAASGLEGRVLSLANYPEKNGHAVTEIRIDGKWRVFDPTYGIYFKNGYTGEIMSFEELRDPTNYGVPVPINKERFAAGGESTGWGTQQVYLHADPAGVIGPSHPMSYPLKLDLQKLDTARFPEDQLSFQGGSYLGAAMICNLHRWELSGLVPGGVYALELTPRSCGGELAPDKFRFTAAIEGGVLERDAFEVTHRAPEVTEIVFTARKDKVTLSLDHPYRGPDFCYMQLREVKLRRISCPAGNGVPEPASWKILNGAECYPGKGLENSLDGEGTRNSTDFRSGPVEFEMTLAEPAKKLTCSVSFYSERDYASVWDVEGLTADGRVAVRADGSGAGQQQRLTLEAEEEISRLRFRFREFQGKGRLRLRLIQAVPIRPVKAAYLQKAVETSRLKPYGNGGTTTTVDREEALRQLLAMPDWQCGNYALYFILSLPRGVRAQICGITNPATGANHAVVEVEEDGGKSVYDPTQGIVYRASLQELVDGKADYHAVTAYGKLPGWRFTLYVGERFFRGANFKKGLSTDHFK